MKARTAERRWMENPVLPSSCMTPAGTSIEVQNKWEENTTHTPGEEKDHTRNFDLSMRCPAAERQNTMFIVCCHPIYSGRQNMWTRPTGSHRRKAPHRSFFPLSFCDACLNFFIARRIRSFLSLVDREV